MKLLDDIIDIAEDRERPCHFVGSIIYLVLNKFSSTNNCVIIDGQQRITTLSLLLLALLDYSKEYYAANTSERETSDVNENIIMPFLETKQKNKGDLRYKLKLFGDDFKVYKNLLNEKNLPRELRDNRDNNVYKNYLFLYNQLNKKKLNPDLIMQGINKLIIIDMPLDEADNAQLVFETVNSTGMKLTQAQLIKNYILMCVAPDKQIDLYDNYWKPVETKLNPIEFDEFFGYYMIVKTQAKVSQEYYKNFKTFMRTSKMNVEDIVREMKSFSDYYLRWKNAEQKNTNLDKKIVCLKEIGTKQVIPTIMQLLFDLEQNKCEESDVFKVLDIIESYLMRIKICTMTIDLSNVCLKILKSLGNSENCENYVSRISACIYNLTDTQHMPTDDEIITKLHSVNIYAKKFASKLLAKIETHENKDYTYTSEHSIEHIMPQTIQSHEDLYKRTDYDAKKKEMVDWAIDLGENWNYIHKDYVNTLGNLTLSGYNSEYQNYRFKYKKDMENGFNDSPIRITKMLNKYDKWTEKEIKDRSDKLAKIIIDIWKYPTSA